MKAAKIDFAESPRLSKKEAREVSAELRKLEDENEVIPPKKVVEAARPPSSPLHKYFEWDNSKAGEKYREWQARQLIGQVFIVRMDQPNNPVRAFVNIRTQSTGLEDEDDPVARERGYMWMPSVAKDEKLRSQVIEAARQQLVKWKSRYGSYKEFFGVVKAINEL